MCVESVLSELSFKQTDVCFPKRIDALKVRTYLIRGVQSLEHLYPLGPHL